MAGDRFLTIGEFSRRVGVSIDLLRAWERRYGVPAPARAPNGRRMYTRADELAVAAMRRALATGMPAAAAAQQAAGEALAEADRHAAGELEEIGERLRDALRGLDEAAAQEALDRLFGAFSVDTALSAVILPCLREIGECWMRNEIGVGDEHFASNLIHGRLLSLARKWDAGHGPRALLACPPGELHTIGLLGFGLALRMHGWRITFLGADTPVAAVAEVADGVDPARIVLASVNADVFACARDELAELAASTPLAIAGAGATSRLASDLGAGLLEGDPVSEAAAVAR